MAQECGFFNAQLVNEEFDRVYLAEQFAAYFAAFVGNGIFGHSMLQLEVKAQDTTNMSTKVLSGEGWINGYWYRNTESYNIEHPIADGVYSRIDMVVLRWSNIDRAMYLHLLVGEPSANPKEPALIRNADIYDLGLARIVISAGATRITQAQISDLRLNSEYCGLVTGLFEQVDLTDIFNQFEQYFLEFKEKHEEDFDLWSSVQKKAFTDFVNAQTKSLNDYIKETKDQYTKWYNDSTTVWKKQYEDWYNNNTVKWESQFEGWYNSNTNVWAEKFNTWFEVIQGQLSDDAAGNLQNEINSINAILREISDNEIDSIVNGTYKEDDEGGYEPDIYSRITRQEIDDAIDRAFSIFDGEGGE